MPMSANLRSAFQGVNTWLQYTLRNWFPRHTLLSILLLGLLQSMIFAAIIPPWWHYDEMGHFEYAWLAANLPPGLRPDNMTRLCASKWHSQP